MLVPGSLCTVTVYNCGGCAGFLVMAPEGCVHVRRGLSGVFMGSGWL